MTDLFELEAPLDDQGTTEAGPAHMRPSAPLSQLARHWEAARGEFDCANMFAGHPDIESHIAELLADPARRRDYDLLRQRNLIDDPLAEATSLWVSYIEKVIS